ncbi:MAG: carboxypeptidase regulatory-like domain-containing protein [Anaerolineales bacterium]|nr:carboxypeptidase regulatory-like domain-containing protein [Anaerolineales bacterium]MCX7756546.1 carboxypeptidase regulatory-like domain-containing protein [Anaerolineales bacterium]MDW8279243.1 SdrD B-like domain-containing protein [Anaerolineales bacterium]
MIRCFWFLGMAAMLVFLNGCQPNPVTPPPTSTPAAWSSLGDLTWFDANANGVQDADEKGLADVTMRLYNAAGTLVAETRSGADGRYAFEGLQPGDYTLEFIAPSGYSLAQADQHDDARDSDPDPATGRTAVISLAAGQSAADWDAGFVPEVVLVPTETPTPAPTLTPTPSGLPPAPREIVIPGNFGNLPARYYPAATNPAPLVVLMHWVRGDMNDWNEVAVWLQNRGQKNPYPNPGSNSWWDPSWFPPMPEGRSYAVLTFTYSGCQPGGCPKITPEKWFSDSMIAMIEARKLPGVDPNRIVAIGSSIGADGVVIGCGEIGCAGALSLSPGDYLGPTYTDAVKKAYESNPQTHLWCLADQREIRVCTNAKSAATENYRAIEIPGGGHGNMLLAPKLDPLPMQLILDFLETVLGSNYLPSP